MSLLDDIKGIDLSAVVNARASISVSLSGDDFQALIDGQGITQALSSMGSAIDALKNAQGEPQALLVPLVDAVAGLSGHFQTGDIEIAEFIDVIREGAEIITQILASIGDGDPTAFKMPTGERLGDVLDHVANFTGHFSSVGFDGAANVKALIDRIDQGFPSDARQFAESAVDLLLPYDVSHLTAIRTGLDSMISGAATIAVDVNINAGLLASLDRIRFAAEAKNAIVVNQELNQLVNIRNNTINSIRAILGQVTAQIQALHIEQHVAVIEQFAGAFRISSEGALEFLQNLQRQFAAVRTLIETAELPELGPIIDNIALKAEEMLRQTIEVPIDRAVNDLKTWLRDQLAHLKLRYYRGQVTAFFANVEKQIRAADLDGPAREARALLDAIEAAIGNFNLDAEIQSALGDIGTTITDTVTTIQTSLQAIVDGVNAAAAGAQNILEQVADKLEQFQQVIDTITDAVEQLGIEQARDQVIAAIEDLKEVAESILGVAPLPDAMRPLVEEVIRELDKIDVNEVLSPVFDALGNLTIPPALLDPINEILAEASQAIENLITEELIASLEAEFQNAIAELEKFDPANLLSEVTRYFDEAAAFIEGLDPRPVVAEIRGPFDAVVRAIDAVHPNKLLRPVIEAYEGVFSALEMPDPADSLGGLNDTLNNTAEQIGRQVSQPLTQLTGQAVREPDQPPPDEGPPTNLPEVRPGDIIRLLGYIPNKLREALQELEAGPAGEVLAVIDSLCGGLARDLRQVQQELWAVERRTFAGIEAILKPLGSAQMQAQLAIQANFQADIGSGAGAVDIDASINLLGTLSTGSLRSDLSQELADARRNIAAIIGRAGGRRGSLMDRLANTLENCALGQIGNDLDGLLAALDPEPLALELDAAARAAINRLPEITALLDGGARTAIERLLALAQQFNPVAQALKFLSVFEVIREELELLNPRRLATELGEIHGAIRDIVLAYDPAVLAGEVYDVIEAVAAQIRSLDPGALLGDLTHFNDLTTTLSALSPATALADIDGQLDEVGARLSAINLTEMLDAINGLPPRIEDSVSQAGQAIIDNLKALLESIQYFSGVSAGVSVQASVG